MKMIRNPYTGLDGYHCFGCSPENECGLKMSFYVDGDAVVSEWQPQRHFIGYENVLHGGVQASLADEAASWYIFVKEETAGVTRNISVDYLKPIIVDNRPIQVRATLSAQADARQRKSAEVTVEIRNADGELCTRAVCAYALYSAKLARAKLSYPGPEAFLE